MFPHFPVSGRHSTVREKWHSFQYVRSFTSFNWQVFFFDSGIVKHWEERKKKGKGKAKGKNKGEEWGKEDEEIRNDLFPAPEVVGYYKENSYLIKVNIQVLSLDDGDDDDDDKNNTDN